jgi:succinate dehydrogenase subunit C
MTDKPAYTAYHPRWYRPRMSTYWWLERPSYLVFILRELSSVFVAWSVVFLLLVVRAVGQGEAEYRSFLSWAATPWVVLINLVAVLFVVLHAVTWFNLAPAAIAIRVRGRRVPPLWIAGGNFALWAFVSVFVLWLLLGRS